MNPMEKENGSTTMRLNLSSISFSNVEAMDICKENNEEVNNDNKEVLDNNNSTSSEKAITWKNNDNNNNQKKTIQQPIKTDWITQSLNSGLNISWDVILSKFDDNDSSYLKKSIAPLSSSFQYSMLGTNNLIETVNASSNNDNNQSMLKNMFWKIDLILDIAYGAKQMNLGKTNNIDIILDNPTTFNFKIDTIDIPTTYNHDIHLLNYGSLNFTLFKVVDTNKDNEDKNNIEELMSIQLVVKISKDDKNSNDYIRKIYSPFS